MVNDIINGISIKLNSVYGDSHKAHTSNVKQGLETPCFFIKCLTVINTPFMGKRKMREYNFDIHYFPKDETDNEEMLAVGEKLIETLEYITLLNGDIIRGTNLDYEIIDGVLHFRVTYKVMLINTGRDDAMDNYGLKVGVET